MPSPTVRFPDPPPPSPSHRRLVLTAIVIGTAIIAVGVLTAGRVMLRALSGETEITALFRGVPEGLKPYPPLRSPPPRAPALSAGEGLRVGAGPPSRPGGFR